MPYIIKRTDGAVVLGCCRDCGQEFIKTIEINGKPQSFIVLTEEQTCLVCPRCGSEQFIPQNIGGEALIKYHMPEETILLH